MADPLSVLGAAGVGVQFGVGAVQSILAVAKQLKALREAPKDVAEAIDDLTRSSERLVGLVSLQSGFVDGLTTDQHARLSGSVAECRGALDGLVAKLQPLREIAGGRKREVTKRLWKRLTYLNLREEINEKRQRIDRLNQDVQRELHIIVAESQGLLRRSTTQSIKLTEERVLPDLSATKAALQVIELTSTATAAEMARSSKQTNDRIDRGFEQMQGHLDRGTEALLHRFESQNNVLHRMEASLEATLQTLESRTRSISLAEWEWDQQLPAISRRQSSSVRSIASSNTLVSSSSHMSALGLEQRQAIQDSLALQLAQYPSQLREAADSVRHRHRHRRRPKTCHCRPTTTTSSTGAARLVAFESGRHSDHAPDCPMRAQGSSSWHYSLMDRLSPIISKAVYLTVGASSGAGGWSISPPLRVVPRIRAVDSPAYQLIEHNRRLFDKLRGAHRLKPWRKKHEQEVLDRLRELNRTLRDYFSSGVRSPYDTDENGLTIWDWIWSRMADLMIPKNDRNIRESLCRILDAASTILETICDYGARPMGESKRHQSRGLLEAWTFEIDVDRKDPEADGWFQIHDILSRVDALDLCSTVDWATIAPCRRREYFKKFPFLTEFLETELHPLTILLMTGYSPKHLEELKRMATPAELLSQRFFKDAPRKSEREGTILGTYRPRDVNAVELAVGWPEALGYLIDLRDGDGNTFNVHRALVQALREKCVESVRQILKTPTDLFSPRQHPSALAMGFAFQENDRTQLLRMLAEELAWRRRQLHARALIALEPDDHTELRITGNPLLLGNSRAVLERMIGDYCAEEVPEALHCHSTFSSFDFLIGVDYHDEKNVMPAPASWSWKGAGDSRWELLSMLFSVGFRDVDAPDKAGETVLYTCCQSRDQSATYVSSWGTVLWLLSHSKERVFPAEVVKSAGSYPGPQFHLAIAIGKMDLADARHLAARAKQILKPSDAQIADGCVCFCSSSTECHSRGFCLGAGCCSPGGCLPHHVLVVIPDWYLSKTQQGCHNRTWQECSRAIALHRWSRWCGLSGVEREEYYLQACRLELFERLGMAHTCCGRGVPAGWVYSLQGPVCPDADERAEMREEDKHSAAVLEYILQEYRAARWSNRWTPVHRLRHKKRPARSFWELWWGAIDLFLPSPTPTSKARAD